MLLNRHLCSSIQTFVEKFLNVLNRNPQQLQRLVSALFLFCIILQHTDVLIRCAAMLPWQLRNRLSVGGGGGGRVFLWPTFATSKAKKQQQSQILCLCRPIDHSTVLSVAGATTVWFKNHKMERTWREWKRSCSNLRHYSDIWQCRSPAKMWSTDFPDTNRKRQWIVY